MEVGESTVHIAEHLTIGPVRVEVSQPLPSLAQRNPRSTELILAAMESQLNQLLYLTSRGNASLDILDEHTRSVNAQLQKTNALLQGIYDIQYAAATRKSWWFRLVERIKHVALFR